MNTTDLDQVIALALHWTETTRKLRKKKLYKQALAARREELRHYSTAAAHLLNEYQNCIDPNTAHLYPVERQRAIAKKYAYSVECMLYRMQVILQGTSAFNTDCQRRMDIVSALTKFSEHYLPLASPGEVQPIFHQRNAQCGTPCSFFKRFAAKLYTLFKK